MQMWKKVTDKITHFTINVRSTILLQQHRIGASKSMMDGRMTTYLCLSSLFLP